MAAADLAKALRSFPKAAWAACRNGSGRRPGQCTCAGKGTEVPPKSSMGGLLQPQQVSIRQGTGPVSTWAVKHMIWSFFCSSRLASCEGCRQAGIHICSQGIIQSRTTGHKPGYPPSTPTHPHTFHTWPYAWPASQNFFTCPYAWPVPHTLHTCPYAWSASFTRPSVDRALALLNIRPASAVTRSASSTSLRLSAACPASKSRAARLPCT